VKVVFVCTGNLCRSPMAEVLLRDALAQRDCTDVEVSSVGTWAMPGSGATAIAVDVMRDMGIDLSMHSSRDAELEELEAADLIVVMTSVHQRELRGLGPHLMDKVVMLKELAEIQMTEGAADPTARLAALLSGQRPKPRRSLDVDDPMGLPRGAYERTAAELRAGTDFLADLLC